MKTLLYTLLLAASVPATAAEPPVWDPGTRTEPTECDRLTAGRYDRYRLAKPKARDEIDVPAAIRQCEADLAKRPNDPRLHFNLGRVYGYAGDKQKTLYHRQAAAALGDTNSIFLLGYLALGEAKDEAARCEAARQMKLAADRGNYSARMAYTSFVLEGRFAACKETPSSAQLLEYAKAAKTQADGFFENRFADHLVSEASAPPADAGQAAQR